MAREERDRGTEEAHESILLSGGHVSFPARPEIACSNSLMSFVATSGFALAANWYARQANLFPVNRSDPWMRPPVRFVTSTPVKLFFVPVLPPMFRNFG